MGEQDKGDAAKGNSSRTAASRSNRKAREKPDKSAARLSGSNVGRVLRTAYDDALREAVPDEFLKLLGKLD